ncbi:pilus assembly protein [Shimia sp.]|uniref:TadE/TadG family type IV pilus assembly protein n=1 Tax=Shimia sp. TaxID=1954381 RepID=UPI003298B2C2
MLCTLSHFLKRFRDDTKGTVAVEAAIVLPMLFWAFMAMAVFFDMYQTRSTSEKAAFTVSDLLSRETAAVDQDYLDNALGLFKSISTLDSVSSLRVSVVSYSDIDDEYFLDWSHGTGLDDGLDDLGLQNMTGHLPVLVNGERLIVVQTFGKYDPPIDVGLGTIDVDTFVFSRPRFAPQLAWSS